MELQAKEKKKANSGGPTGTQTGTLLKISFKIEELCPMQQVCITEGVHHISSLTH
jgi:hypothetical protein